MNTIATGTARDDAGKFGIASWRELDGEGLVKSSRRQCHEVVRRLEIPKPFDVAVLCARLGAQRGRPLHLIPMEMPPQSPSGLYVSTDTLDAIVYESRTSGLHQVHIILHELGHLLSGHTAVPGEGDLSALVPHLGSVTMARMLGRTRYNEPEERQAELIASLILERAGRWRPRRSWAPAAGDLGVAQRLERSLEYRQDL
ncbi:hypothetical protein ACEZDB_32565 [Streptacidiphilus sp. N1-3]|uniref:IrrE N-terminal-like domain-containing protein n=1 Tax=Streptacidiphilus alkalitolerans TaxID=3342712 RepID=A0ABV6XAU0_9ACTN